MQQTVASFIFEDYLFRLYKKGILIWNTPAKRPRTSILDQMLMGILCSASESIAPHGALSFLCCCARPGESENPHRKAGGV
jgi:hypothetical protein